VRASIHKLLLTPDEFNWVVRTIQRKATLAEKVEKDKRLKNLVLRFADKFAELPLPEASGNYVLGTNRNELRFLETVVENTNAALVATVIPGYEDKAKAKPEHAAHFEAYRQRALEETAMLVGLLNKIRRAL
jgi:hypothetical protein